MIKSILLLLSISAYIFASNIKTMTAEFPEKEMKKQNIEIAQMSVKALSKDLPQKIDKYTTLTNITSKETLIIWTFEINTGVKSDESIIKEDHSRMKKAVTTGICQSSSKFLIAGISISYVYISAKSKANLFKFDIAQKDCISK